jgi:RNA polymerase sigma-70 factor, ECF subfamily
MRAADRAAIRAAMRANSNDLLAFHERRVACREDAADLLGETLLQAWRRVGAFPAEEPTRQRMWLFGIATNVQANHRRSLRRRMALVDRLRTHLAPASIPDATESTAVRDAVGRLPEAQRDLVTLVHWEGFTLLEAARILDLNPSTARSRYAAARGALRVALTQDSLT